MKTKKLLISFLASLIVIFFISNVYAEDKKKPEKVKGKIITNLEKNYVKVITKDYKVHQIYFHKKTKVEAIVKAKIDDLAIPKEGRRFPTGTVTFVIKDGKSMAEKISYKSGASWGIKKKKKKKK
jgi:hypothetical protein